MGLFRKKTDHQDEISTAVDTPAEPASDSAAEERKRFSERMLSGASQQQQTEEEKRQRKALMKKFKKSKNVPTEAQERFTPDLDKGLSEEQVELRFNQFLFNDVNKKYSKSYASILVGNIFTFFNLLCVIVAVALIYAGADISQFLFAGIFAINLFIGIVQEVLAKKQIDKLSVLVSSTVKAIRGGQKTEIPVNEIVVDDVLSLEAGQQIPADCVLAEGVVECNESLLTGESVPVKKEIGDMMYAGSFVASGACRVRVDKVGRGTYLNSLTSRAKKYKKPRSEIMNSINLFIRVIAVLIVVISAITIFINWKATQDVPQTIMNTAAVVVGMIPSGLLLLTSIAMAAGVRRLAKKNTLVQDLYSLEMLARVDVLCLDKTGTITDGRMTVNDCMILNNFTDYSLEDIMGSMLLSLEDNNQTSIALEARFGHSTALHATAKVPFSSKRKLSAVSFGETGTFVMGAPEFVLRPMPPKIEKIVKQYAQSGLRVLVLAYSPSQISGDKIPSLLRPMAIITLADNIRPDAVDTIKWFRENEVEIKIISGDNPVTVSEVARRVGVKNASSYISLDGLTEVEVQNVATQYTVFGRVTPEQKAILVQTLKKQGSTVAMTGDGVNDILALKEADCAISVASGSEAARNVSHLVLTDNNFLNLPSVVYEGRRVINNIKASASLYITKTLFITMLAILCACMQVPYFFRTNNMLLFEVLVAAFPSAVVTIFQPNAAKVKGKFIPFVMSRSIPGAITLILCVLTVYGGIRLFPESFGELFSTYSVTVNGEAELMTLSNPLFTLAMTCCGLVILYRILQPFNVMRAVVYAISVGVTVLVFCVPILGDFIWKAWDQTSFDITKILFLLVIILASFPVSGTLVKLCDMMNPSTEE